MKHLSKRVRLILGIATVLVSVLLVWGLAPVLGEMSLLLVLLGGGIFIRLNPELMSGD